MKPSIDKILNLPGGYHILDVSGIEPAALDSSRVVGQNTITGSAFISAHALRLLLSAIFYGWPSEN